MSNLKLSLVGQGLLDPRQMSAWTLAQQERIRKGTERAMRVQGREMAKEANNQARSALKIRRKSFPNIRAKVYSARKNSLPALRIYSNVPWLGIHERGGVIRGSKGKVLVPLLRIGFKAFKRVVDTVMRTGAGFFRQVNGKVFLFAEYQPEYGQPLARFRRLERQRQGGGRIKKGADIPIAVLLPQVSIRKRIRLEATVRQSLPALVNAIEREI
jgi:hypothetical protein